MISLQKHFLFIHVPKTGGNSIQNVLQQYSEDEIVIIADYQDGIERFEVRNSRYKIHKHSTLREYKEVLDSTFYKSLFKFAVIRNPWDMMISWYFSPHRKVTEWVRNDFVRLIDEVPTLDHYITVSSSSESTYPTLKDICLFQEKFWVHPLIRHIDFLVRFEKLNEDFAKVCRKLRVPYSQLPIRNRSSRGHYSKYYDAELREMVGLKFHQEIAFGNYQF